MLYEISNNFMKVTISDHGAELQSIKSAAGIEYLWQGDAAYWKDRALNLFPYIARQNQGKYIYKGTEYPMQIHGFVPYLRLAVTEQQRDSICFTLQDSEETRKEYPFAFRYEVRYQLENTTLKTTYTVENTGTERMYFGIGGHPGINVPLEPDKAFEDYTLEFSKTCEPVRIGFNEDCLCSGADTPYPLAEGRKIPLRHTLFDEDAIVLQNAAKEVTLFDKEKAHGVAMKYEDMTYLGLWHMPDTDAPYVCLEPWSSLPAKESGITDLETQKDLQALDAKKTGVFTWSLTCF